MAIKGGAGTNLSNFGPRTRRRWRRRLGYGALILLLAGAIFYAGLRYHWRHEFLRRVEAIRASGSPVTLEELNKSYQWPESGENAAAAILSAASCYVPPTEKAAEETLWSILGGQRLRRAEPLDEDSRTMLAEHLKANAQALGFLRDTTALEGSRYPMDLTKGFGQFPMYIGEVINKANILPCLEAILHAENGDPRRASEAVLTSLAVTRSLAWEPMVGCQINRLTCQKVALIALQRVLSRVDRFADDQLLALSRALTKASDADSWTRALIGERCIIIAMHERPDLVEPAVGPSVPQFVINAQKELGLADRSGIAFLKLMDRLMQVRQLPAQERLDSAAEVDKARHALPGSFFIIHEAAPYAVGVVRWELTETARLATASCGLAVQRYRLAHGALPEALRELVPMYLPDVPLDPFDGKPLRYKRLERGYVIYSAGPDGTDDGGKEQPPAVRGKPDISAYDITFTVER